MTAVFLLTALLVGDAPAKPLDLLDDRLTRWEAIAKPPGDGSQTWSCVEGVLTTTGKPTGALMTREAFGAYELRLGYRYLPNTLKRPNSGVLFHCQPGAEFWPHGYEVQLAHGENGDLWLQPDAQNRYPRLTVPDAQVDQKNADRRHFFRLPGVEERPHPAWNSVKVVARGDTVEVFVNDALANRATGLSLTRGRIGLQAEGAPAEFRRVRLTPLADR